MRTNTIGRSFTRRGATQITLKTAVHKPLTGASCSLQDSSCSLPWSIYSQLMRLKQFKLPSTAEEALAVAAIVGYQQVHQSRTAGTQHERAAPRRTAPLGRHLLVECLAAQVRGVVAAGKPTRECPRVWPPPCPARTVPHTLPPASRHDPPPGHRETGREVTRGLYLPYRSGWSMYSHKFSPFECWFLCQVRNDSCGADLAQNPGLKWRESVAVPTTQHHWVGRHTQASQCQLACSRHLLQKLRKPGAFVVMLGLHGQVCCCSRRRREGMPLERLEQPQ